MPLRDLWATSSVGPVQRALSIKPLYAACILAGVKRWELRKQNSHIRGKVAVFASATGCIWGTVEITSTVWKSRAELEMPCAFNEHQVSTQELSTYCRSTGAYAWILSSPRLLQQPVPWTPPLGTVNWSFLSEEVIDRLRISEVRTGACQGTVLWDMQNTVCERQRARKRKYVEISSSKDWEAANLCCHSETSCTCCDVWREKGSLELRQPVIYYWIIDWTVWYDSTMVSVFSIC